MGSVEITKYRLAILKKTEIESLRVIANMLVDALAAITTAGGGPDNYNVMLFACGHRVADPSSWRSVEIGTIEHCKGYMEAYSLQSDNCSDNFVVCAGEDMVVYPEERWGDSLKQNPRGHLPKELQ